MLGKCNPDKIRTIFSFNGIELNAVKLFDSKYYSFYECTLDQLGQMPKLRRDIEKIEKEIHPAARIVAPIPGTINIGIEIPKVDCAPLFLCDLLSNFDNGDCTSGISMPLGISPQGTIVSYNLSKSDSLIFIGQNCEELEQSLNTFIWTLVSQNQPNKINFILADMSNLDIFPTSKISPYIAKIPSISGKIIKTTEEYGELISSLGREVSRRKEILRNNKARTIDDYNLTHGTIPHIVVVINSINDLWSLYGVNGCHGLSNLVMSVHGVGIHIWLTSRTVLRKQSFYELLDCLNDKIIFKLSDHDSKYLLGCNDANSLSGKGDMLYCNGATNFRAQIPTIDSFEVNVCANKIRDEYGIDSFYILPEDESALHDSDMLSVLDPMFDVAAELVVSTGQGSTSMIQRKFAIGYNRAGHIMDQLEMAGIVGPYVGSKNRAVLIDTISELELLLHDLSKNREERPHLRVKELSDELQHSESSIKSELNPDNNCDTQKDTIKTKEKIVSNNNNYKIPQTEQVNYRTRNDNGYCFLMIFVFIIVLVLGYFLIVSPLIAFFSKETKFEKKKRLMREKAHKTYVYVPEVKEYPSLFDYVNIL